MISLFTSFLTCLSAFIRTRYDLSIEILALRQPWPRWNNVLVIVKPETVVSWHRKGFRFYWRLKSRAKNPGRLKIDAELRALIRRMVDENPTWGAPRIHSELLKLSLNVSKRTVSRYVSPLSPENKARQLWKTFLRNHREVIATMDFFTVPTFSCRVLYCFLAIEHGRRKILYFNATDHPTANCIVQQLREAFPEPCPFRHVILDRAAKFGNDVADLLISTGIKPKRTSFKSPWQKDYVSYCTSLA